MPIIDDHIVPGDTGYCTVSADDRDPRCGNAAHEFIVTPDGGTPQIIRFQHGPVKEHGVNGVQDSAVIAVLIERFEGFQAGNFACEANAAVLGHLRAALNANLQRTRDRVARQVEGTSAA